MTFAVAWKRQERIYCIADTAVTGRQVGPDSHLVTSFGEVSSSDEEVVQERLRKIRPIGPNSAVAFSGDVEYALECVRQLRQCASTMSLIPSMRKVARSLGYMPEKRVKIILIEYDKKNEPILATWDSKDLKNIEHHEEHAVVGSLGIAKSNLKEIHEHFCGQFHKMSEWDVFHAIIALLQRTNMHYTVIDNGVAGVLFGASVDRDGFNWNDDITYIQYALSSDSYKAKLLRCGVSDGVGFVVGSPYRGIVGMIDSDQCPLQPDEWLEKYKNIDVRNSKYYAWIQMDGNNVTIIKLDTKYQKNDFFEIEKENEEGGGGYVRVFRPFSNILMRQDERPQGVWVEFLRMFKDC